MKIVIMTVTKMARPRMATRPISKVIKEAKVVVMLQDKYNVITAQIRDMWPEIART